MKGGFSLKLFRKTLACILVVCISLATIPLQHAGAATAPALTANIAYAIDPDTGAVLYEKNADAPRSIASLAKLMTATMVYDALDKGEINWDTKIPISPEMRAYAYSDYSGQDFNFPEEETVWNLMHLLLIASSNVTASIFAEYLSGSEDAFVNDMNAKAREMGLTASFQDAAGLYNSAVTARSIVTLANELYRSHPEFINFTRQSGGTYNGKPYRSMNRLYRDFYYEGADGIKTGWTPSAGFSFLATAERNDRRVIGVVIGSTSFDNEFVDGRALLDYGFSVMPEKGTVPPTAAAPAPKPETTPEPEPTPAPEPVVEPVEPEPPVTENPEEPVEPEPTETHPTSDWARETVVEAGILGYDFTDIAGRSAFNGSETLTRGEFAALLAQLYNPGVFYSNNTPFNDLPADAWYSPYVGTAYAQGIVAGTALDAYSPDALITREQVAVMIARPEGLRSTETFGFIDEADITPDMREQVNAVAETGLMIGDPQSRFHPKAPITREEATVIIVRLHHLMHEAA